MAERRMFSKKITDADEFTSLPPTTQALYFHMCMGADDDGFSNKIRVAMFNAHADTNDFNLLVQKRYIIPFESGVIVIKHWRMHNLIKTDRYHETSYLEEKSTLVLKENGVYTESGTQVEPVWNPSGTQVEPKWNPSGAQMEPQVRLGKDRLGKDRLGKVKIEKKTGVDSTFFVENSNLSEPVKVKLLDFLAYRSEIKKPYKSERGIRSLITEVEKQEQTHGSIAVIECIDTTMQNGWQGIFWDKITGPKSRSMSLEEAATFLEAGGSFFE